MSAVSHGYIVWLFLCRWPYTTGEPFMLRTKTIVGTKRRMSLSIPASWRWSHMPRYRDLSHCLLTNEHFGLVHSEVGWFDIRMCLVWILPQQQPNWISSLPVHSVWLLSIWYFCMCCCYSFFQCLQCINQMHTLPRFAPVLCLGIWDFPLHLSILYNMIKLVIWGMQAGCLEGRRWRWVAVVEWLGQRVTYRPALRCADCGV